MTNTLEFMKNLFVFLLTAVVSVCNLNAQEQLEPTQLGKWKKPASTGIAAVDNYVNHCAGMYEEAMNLRKQYEAIGAVSVNVGEAAAIAENDGEVVKSKIAEYEALTKRIEAQKIEAEKIPNLVEAATKAVPLGLKAVAATKAISSTKEAVSLATEENTSLLKAISAQISSLSTAPVQIEE